MGTRSRAPDAAFRPASDDRSPHVMLVVRTAWLTLCGMMLVSRVVFARRGPAGTRAFLDLWRVSPVRRAWGVTALTLAGGVVVVLLGDRAGSGRADRLVAWSLVATLVADGALNVTPSGFTTFKDTVQQRWVAAHPDGAGDDRSLFAFGNAVLGIASVATASGVARYRPLPRWCAALATTAAAIVTPALVRLAERDDARAPSHGR